MPARDPSAAEDGDAIGVSHPPPPALMQGRASQDASAPGGWCCALEFAMGTVPFRAMETVPFRQGITGPNGCQGRVRRGLASGPRGHDAVLDDIATRRI